MPILAFGRRERKEKKVPDQRSEESKRRKFPIKDWEKAKKKEKFPIKDRKKAKYTERMGKKVFLLSFLDLSSPRLASSSPGPSKDFNVKKPARFGEPVTS